MNKKITFLTEKFIDKNRLLEILKLYSTNIVKHDDKLIFDEILLLLENDKLTLTPQEIKFLNTNPQSLWGEYLVFRYKFDNFTKNLKFFTKYNINIFIQNLEFITI